jgi:NAD(P)-dependent dehydrogenase (short-subunit alcohol dehydrogenase family)
MNRRILLAAAIGLTGLGPVVLLAQTAPGRRAVLVTGASTGIGRRITEVLAAKGYYVYAGARKPEDIAALSKIPSVEGIRLDVTSQVEIDAAVEAVRKGGRGLHGLVNNAGTAVLGFLIETEEKDLTFLFDVNVYGPWRMVKAFAPMLIDAKGRIANISSISGIHSDPMLGVYSMTKHAVEAYGDALRAELARFGVKVSSVEPGNYKSSIGRTVISRMGDIEALAAKSRYPDEFRTLKRLAAAPDSGMPEPDDVAAAVDHAMSDPNPRVRYMVVPAADQALGTILKAIEEMVELNQGHRFTIPRDSLVRLVDEVIARTK